MSSLFTLVNGRSESFSNFDVNLYKENKEIYPVYWSVLTSEATSLAFSVADLSATEEERSVRLGTASERVVRIEIVRYIFNEEFGAFEEQQQCLIIYTAEPRYVILVATGHTSLRHG